MSIAHLVRRYKDKNYLAKNVHYELYFFAKVHIFLEFCAFYCRFLGKTTINSYRNVWIWTVPPVEVKRIWRPR